jgi:ABC-type multidrug transport system fused ATPase/permease subunit
VSPTDSSLPAGDRRTASAWREARALVWSHRRRLVLGLLLLAIGRLAALVLPASSKYLIDEVVGHSRGQLLGPLALAIVAAALVQAGTSFWLSQVLGVAAQREIMRMRRRLHRHVTRLPIQYFDSTRTGVLISRIINDPDGLRNLLGNGLIQLLSSLLTGVLALAVLLYLNWRLTAITLLMLGAFGALMGFAFTRLRPLFRQRAELNAQLTGSLAESLNGIRIIKAYRAAKREELGFARRIHRLFRNVAREITLSSAVGAGAILIFSAIAATLFFLGGRAILSGAMTLGDFVMFVFFIGLLITPVVRIADSATQLGEAFGGFDRIRELRAVATETDDDEAREPVTEVCGEIAFDAVGFEYSPGLPVLQDVSFRVRPGATVALVGPSGAGKSTIIGLVMGFHRPRSGQLRIDGRDLSRLRLDEYRSHLGVVLQETFLFDGSIAENIAFARPRASRQDVEQAGRLAHCDEIARRLERGYDTIVGERGVRLSGGERQRVAIARAILADPRILILDEATSSLDSESEALVQDGLRRLRRGRTTIVIAHRLSTIRSADEILVLEGGRIVERGSHGELLARKGRYLALHERQYGVSAEPKRNEEMTGEPDGADTLSAAPRAFDTFLGSVKKGGL